MIYSLQKMVHIMVNYWSTIKMNRLTIPNCKISLHSSQLHIQSFFQWALCNCSDVAQKENAVQNKTEDTHEGCINPRVGFTSLLCLTLARTELIFWVDSLIDIIVWTHTTVTEHRSCMRTEKPNGPNSQPLMFHITLWGKKWGECIPITTQHQSSWRLSTEP